MRPPFAPEVPEGDDGRRAPKVVEVVNAGIIGTFVRVFTRSFPVFVRLVVKLFFTRKI